MPKIRTLRLVILVVEEGQEVEVDGQSAAIAISNGYAEAVTLEPNERKNVSPKERK